jgi:hypothetical protein
VGVLEGRVLDSLGREVDADILFSLSTAYTVTTQSNGK